MEQRQKISLFEAKLRHARHYGHVVKLVNSLYHGGGEHLSHGLSIFDNEQHQIDCGWAWALTHAGKPQIDDLLMSYTRSTSVVANLRYDARHELMPRLLATLAAAQRKKELKPVGEYLNLLGSACADIGEWHQAMLYYQQAFELADQIADGAGKSSALNNIGLLCVDRGMFREAIELYHDALTIDRDLANHQGEVITLGNLGLIYTTLCDYDRAMDCHQQRLSAARAIGDLQGEAYALSGLGLAYSAAGQHQRGLVCLEDALAIDRSLGDRRGEMIDLGNLGSIYVTLADFRHALACHQSALAIARDLGERRQLAYMLNSVGVACIELEETDLAIAYFEQGLLLAREVDDSYSEAALAWNLGLERAKQGKIEEAIMLMQIRVDFEQEQQFADVEENAAKVALLHQILRDQSSTL